MKVSFKDDRILIGVDDWKINTCSIERAYLEKFKQAETEIIYDSLGRAYILEIRIK